MPRIKAQHRVRIGNCPRSSKYRKWEFIDLDFLLLHTEQNKRQRKDKRSMIKCAFRCFAFDSSSAPSLGNNVIILFPSMSDRLSSSKFIIQHFFSLSTIEFHRMRKFRNTFPADAVCSLPSLMLHFLLSVFDNGNAQSSANFLFDS